MSRAQYASDLQRSADRWAEIAREQHAAAIATWDDELLRRAVRLQHLAARAYEQARLAVEP